MKEQVQNLLSEFIWKAKRDNCYAYLADVPTDSYKERADELEEIKELFISAIMELHFLEGHKHEYGENDYCIHCGLDGRA